MNAIKVRRNELLGILKKNREEHRKIFLEAQEGYKNAAIKELEQHLADARGGKKIRRGLTLVEPVDQTADYDRVIRMLELSTDELIELEEHDFMQYVQDDWGWKRQFLIANSNYSATATAAIS